MPLAPLLRRHGLRAVPVAPPTQFLRGVLVLDLNQSLEEACAVWAEVEYQLWLVDLNRGRSAVAMMRCMRGERN